MMNQPPPSELERLVLEKHQLRQYVDELQALLLAVVVSHAEDDKVRLTKAQINNAANYTVEVKVLKSGSVNLIVREKDAGS